VKRPRRTPPAPDPERPYLQTPPPGVSLEDWRRDQARLPAGERGRPPGESVRRFAGGLWGPEPTPYTITYKDD